MTIISFQEFSTPYEMGNFSVPGNVGTEIWSEDGDILGILDGVLVYSMLEDWHGDLYTVADIDRWAEDAKHLI